MNFKEAYTKLLEGKKVKRKAANTYLYYSKRAGCFFISESKNCDDVPLKELSIEDALAEDWEVVEEEKKKYWVPNHGEIFYEIYRGRIHTNTNYTYTPEAFNFDVQSRTYFKVVPFNVYFTSSEVANKAIETIGEDRIKKYYFDVEDEKNADRKD